MAEEKLRNNMVAFMMEKYSSKREICRWKRESCWSRGDCGMVRRVGHVGVMDRTKG